MFGQNGLVLALMFTKVTWMLHVICLKFFCIFLFNILTCCFLWYCWPGFVFLWSLSESFVHLHKFPLTTSIPSWLNTLSVFFRWKHSHFACLKDYAFVSHYLHLLLSIIWRVVVGALGSTLPTITSVLIPAPFKVCVLTFIFNTYKHTCFSFLCKT